MKRKAAQRQVPGRYEAQHNVDAVSLLFKRGPEGLQLHSHRFPDQPPDPVPDDSAGDPFRHGDADPDRLTGPLRDNIRRLQEPSPQTSAFGKDHPELPPATKNSRSAHTSCNGQRSSLTESL